MHNINLLARTKVELYDLTICIAVNGEKFLTVTMASIRQYPISIVHVQCI